MSDQPPYPPPDPRWAPPESAQAYPYYPPPPAVPPGIELAVPALAAYGAQLPQPQPELAGCLFVAPATCRDVPFAFGAPFVFWDIVHPTTGAHRALGDYLFKRLSQ